VSRVAGVASLLAAAALAGAIVAPAVRAATITPSVSTDNFSNNGNCTLREAVQAANTNLARDACPAGSASGPDTIVLPDAFYLLNLPGSENANASGDLDVITTATAGPLVVKSDGDLTEINGNLDDRVIDDSSSGSSLTLERVRLNDGQPPTGDGGALRSTGSSPVTLLHTEVKNSGSAARGGGMRVAGDLTLIGSTVSGNDSTTTTGVVGAGISSGGDLSLSASTVSGNHVDAPDDAGTDDLRGGGIAAQAGSIAIFDSTVSGNAVNSFDVLDTAGGGGIFAENVPVTITDSTVSTNSANGAGGVSVAGGLFYNDLAPLDGFLKIQNATFSGNSSQTQGGAIQIFGGISGIRSSTFSGNSVTSATAKGIYYDDFATVASSMQVGSTLLADAAAGECAGPDPLTTNGFNIDRGTSCALTGTGDLQNTNPGLLGLTGNGGPTQTHAVPPGSPALDRILTASCTQIDTTPLTADQRGAPRGFDEDGDSLAECDVGAYELNRCQGKIVDLPGSSGINGTAAADVILGSDGADQIDPRQGDDTICSGEGGDAIFERLNGGSDSVDGGGGSDKLFLGGAALGSPGGTLDLAAGTATATGMNVSLSSFENASGSIADDTLIGDDGPNVLDGGVGNDTVDGGAGPDTLLGGNDDDQLLARDGFGDTVDCGDGAADTAQTDRLSLDAVTGCESVDAIAEPSILAPPTAEPPAATPTASKAKCKKKPKRHAAAAKKKRCKKKRKK
jgi:CSLREA domain-containing protein